MTTLSLGLSKTLTASDSLYASASLGKTSDFGIVLTKPTLDPILFPGQDYDFNVSVTSANHLPAYLIAKVELPTDFKVDGNDTFSPAGWTRLEEDVNHQPLTDVYYFGSDGDTAVFTESTTLISKIRLNPHPSNPPVILVAVSLENIFFPHLELLPLKII